MSGQDGAMAPNTGRRISIKWDLKFGWIGELMAASCAAGALIIYATVIIATSEYITLSLIIRDAIQAETKAE
jgi:hypothetical protein